MAGTVGSLPPLITNVYCTPLETVITGMRAWLMYHAIPQPTTPDRMEVEKIQRNFVSSKMFQNQE